MRLCGILLILGCLFLIGCDEDPAQSVKIVPRPAQTTTAPSGNPAARVSPPASAALVSPVLPELNCQLASRDLRGPSEFVAQGPCAFQFRAKANCQAMADDFYVALTRTAQNGAAVVVYLNVEQYKGPGTYNWAQMLVALYSQTTIYRWSNNNVHADVAPGEASVTLSRIALVGEPLMVGCTSAPGSSATAEDPTGSLPKVNCAGRSGPVVVNGGTEEFIEGSLECTRD